MAVDVDKLRDIDEFDDTEPSSLTLKKAVHFVETKAFPKPKHWSAEELDQLVFPTDLTNLNFDELGRQMSVWTSVIAYTQYQVAMSDVENTAKYNKLEYERKKLYLKLLDKTMKEEQRKSIIKTEPPLVKLQAESDLAKAKYVLLDSLLSSYSAYYKSFSRELSRREAFGTDRPPCGDHYNDVDLSEGIEKGKNLFNAHKKSVMEVT